MPRPITRRLVPMVSLKLCLCALIALFSLGVWQGAPGAGSGSDFSGTGIHLSRIIGISPVFAEEEQPDVYYKTRGSGANVRSGHSTKSDVLGVLLPGDVVKLIKEHRSWKYVEAVESGLRGWVWENLLRAYPDYEPPENEEKPEVTEETDPDTGNEDGQDAGEEEQSESDEDAGPEGASIRIISNITDPEDIFEDGANDAIDIKPAEDKDKPLSSPPPVDSASSTGGSDLIALITAESVNLRTEPSLDSQIITQVDTYEKVYIIEEKKPWYFVSVPKIAKKGWVFGDFVKPLDYVIVTGDNVNLREKPGLASKVIMTLPKGMRFVKKAWQENYVLVAHPGKGYTGWVHQKYVEIDKKSPPPTYIVNGYSVNFRKNPSIVSEIHTRLDTGTRVTVLGREEKWTKVKHRGRTGWIYSEYLVPEGSSRGARGTRGNLGVDLIDRALNLRGTPYRWSGKSIKGFDCSGFIYYLIQTEMGAISLPRSSRDMFYNLGVSVDKEDLERGDIVFFTTYKKGPSHVGLYLGDGDFVHASSAKGKVVMSNMSEGYYKRRFIGAKRLPRDYFKKYTG